MLLNFIDIDFLQKIAKYFLAPLIISLIVFGTNWYHNKLKERKRLKNLWGFIEIWIENTLKVLQLQCNDLEEQIRSFEEFDLIPKFKKYENDVDRILNIPHSDLYSVFIGNRISLSFTPEKAVYTLIISLKLVKNSFNTHDKIISEITQLLADYRSKIDNQKKLLDNKSIDLIRNNSISKSTEFKKLDEKLNSKLESSQDYYYKTLYEVTKEINKFCLYGEEKYISSGFESICSISGNIIIEIEELQKHFIVICRRLERLKDNYLKQKKGITKAIEEFKGAKFR